MPHETVPAEDDRHYPANNENLIEEAEEVDASNDNRPFSSALGMPSVSPRPGSESKNQYNDYKPSQPERDQSFCTHVSSARNIVKPHKSYTALCVTDYPTV